MVNEPLRRAIAQSGHDLDEIATIAGVDLKTVNRWLTGRIPHPRHRHKVANALEIDEYDLWPDTRRTGNRDADPELVAAYARRSDPDAPDWQTLLRAAEQQIDMLGYSLLQIAETRGINKLLTTKAHEAIPIRIALANPASEPVLAADLAQRPAGRLIPRIENARQRFLPLLRERGIELREHHVPTSHTILRFDHQLLLTIHLHGTPGFQAPLIHVRHERDYGLFDQLVKHFEDIWLHALPVSRNLGAGPGERSESTTPDGSSSVLDDLDYVWRPGS